jgi:hypothetical protein
MPQAGELLHSNVSEARWHKYAQQVNPASLGAVADFVKA